MTKDSIQVMLLSNPSNSAINVIIQSEPTNNSRFRTFNVSADWLLESKAELINGISYSPTLEFNLTSQNGFNFQVQTGALPIFNGIRIQKTQPAAGLSFSYKF